MKFFKTEFIRNVVFMGQGSAGKTTLAESMLYLTKAVDRLGKVSDGTTASDYDPEEIKRKISISSSLLPIEWKNHKINIIDAPGYFDFEGEVVQGMRAADAAVIVVSGKDGISVGSNKAFELTKEKNIPRAFFISKLDEENTDFFKVYESLKEKYGAHVCAVNIPIIEGGQFKGVLNVIDMKANGLDAKGTPIELTISAELEAKANEYRESLNEMIAETCEELIEKYFAGEPFTPDETKKGMGIGILAGDIIPVMCGSGLGGNGVDAFMDIITEYFPIAGSALIEKGTDQKGDKIEIPIKDTDPVCALAFKTIADPFVGRLTYFKIISGTFKKDLHLVNARTQATEKIGHIFFIRGKKQFETDSVAAGDICVVSKLDKTKTGDTLCDPSRVVSVYGIDFPKPCLSMAILPQAKGDEEKIGTGLHKLREEDRTFVFENNVETHQQVVSGLGEMHIDVLVSKLKNKFGTLVLLEEPRVAYRETIRSKVSVEGKHKKQSGGHGQFGHVKMDFEPSDSPELIFEEKIFGGSVPKNYFPAVEKGLQDSVSKGVLAGYPVVNIKATLTDGSFHPVDSSEMAFKIAASLAFKEGMTKANPVLLEPIGILNVIVEDAQMGDVIGDINKRRGHILGMTPSEKYQGFQEVSAQVPMSEMGRYAIDLRSITRGSGNFTLVFDRYSEAPANIVQKVVEESKQEE